MTKARLKITDDEFHSLKWEHEVLEQRFGKVCSSLLACPDASVVHASGSGQLHVACPWISPGKPTRKAVTTMGSIDLVVDADHMFGPSCQRYNWQTGRCGSIALGSSPRRGKTLI